MAPTTRRPRWIFNPVTGSAPKNQTKIRRHGARDAKHEVEQFVLTGVIDNPPRNEAGKSGPTRHLAMDVMGFSGGRVSPTL